MVVRTSAAWRFWHWQPCHTPASGQTLSWTANKVSDIA